MLASVVDYVVHHGGVGRFDARLAGLVRHGDPGTGCVADGRVDLVVVGDSGFSRVTVAVESHLPQVRHLGELGLALVFGRAEGGDDRAARIGLERRRECRRGRRAP